MCARAAHQGLELCLHVLMVVELLGKEAGLPPLLYPRTVYVGSLTCGTSEDRVFSKQFFLEPEGIEIHDLGADDLVVVGTA